MLVNAPHLPNIEHIIETSRGKRSCHLDLRTDEGRAGLRGLLQEADAFIQGYRPGGLADLGFSPEAAAEIRPGLVYISLSAYGHVGPWADRRGFDSLVQTATGFNDAEMLAASEAKPRPMPVQILDYASGFLMAFAMQAARLRQATEGGSWHVRIGLAQTAQWLRSLGRVPEGLKAPKPDPSPRLETSPSGWGELRALRHAAQLTHTTVGWRRPAMPPGSHVPSWTWD